jgi:phage terminase small subunit
MALNVRQRRFVSEYLINPNATQAALKAGYSKKTAYSIGQENLKKPEIAAALSQGEAKRAAKLEITAETVLSEMGTLGFAKIGHKHVKASDKRAALADIGKHLGMFSERHIISGTLTLEALVGASFKAPEKKE